MPQHPEDALRQFAAFERNAAGRRLKAESVPQFERSERVRIAPAHGAVDLDDAVRNFRHHLGGVADVLAEQLPQEPADFVVERDESLQAVGERLDFAHGFERSEAGLIGGVVFEGLAVERVDFSVLADALVKALAALVAEPSALKHFNQERRQLELLAERVVGNGLVEILRDVLPDVEPDDVEEAIAGALGKADQRAGEGVHFLDGEIVFDGQALDRGAEESADSVADEVRRVFAGNDAFAEMAVAEIGDERNDIRTGCRAGNDFDQMEVARRIEEMRTEKVLAEFGRDSLRRFARGECRWCWWRRWRPGRDAGSPFRKARV